MQLDGATDTADIQKAEVPRFGQHVLYGDSGMKSESFAMT